MAHPFEDTSSCLTTWHLLPGGRKRAGASWSADFLWLGGRTISVLAQGHKGTNWEQQAKRCIWAQREVDEMMNQQ